MKDFCVIGAGIFGLSTAICLREQGFSVQLINHGVIPDPLAASTDISKIVRMEYGSDDFYMHCANQCIDRWQLWNEKFERRLYHQVGFLLLSKTEMDRVDSSYESASYHHLLKQGFAPERLSGSEITYRYPMFGDEVYADAFFHAKAGYAESGVAVQVLHRYALDIGIEVADATPVEVLKVDADIVKLVKAKSESFAAGHFVVAAGSGAKDLVPGLDDKLVATGHPVFHISPGDKSRYAADSMPVFAADIARSGWYGFPLHPTADVVKVANHGVGEVIEHYDAERVVRPDEERALNSFLHSSIPGLASEPIVYRRKCVYTDTYDGHFIIDRHPDISNLTIATGGSGHGFKMGPLIGEWASNAAMGNTEQVPERFRWREFDRNAVNEEQARNFNAS